MTALLGSTQVVEGNEIILEDDKVFQAAWIQGELFQIIGAAVSMLLWMFPSLFIYLYFRLPESVFTPLWNLALFFAPIQLLGVYGLRKKMLPSYVCWSIIEITYLIYLLYVLHIVTSSSLNISEILVFLCGFFGVAIYSIAMFPLPFYFGIFTAALFIGLLLFGLLAIPNVPFDQTFAITSIGVGFGTALRIHRYRSIEREAQLILESLKLHRFNQSLERQNYERELFHAQKIQDSFLPPPENLVIPGMKVRFFQEKHGILGGDWMAARILPNGHFVGLIADVTGKSISASLVVHALQSLWVQATFQPDFEPVNWLRKLNSVLLTMGAKSPHTMTLGIVSVMKNSLIYYSAAHIPLFVINKKTGKIRALAGGGSLLGISHQIEIKPVFFSWEEKDQISIILASDGVFPRGSRTTAREVLELENVLSNSFYNAPPLSYIQSSDDKFLLHIESLHQPGGGMI